MIIEMQLLNTQEEKKIIRTRKVVVFYHGESIAHDTEM